MLLLAAAVFTASMNVDLDLSVLIKRQQVKEPKVTCGIVTVGYRFRGKPGQVFSYAGDKYEIPAEGWVELIADSRRTTYAVAGKSLPLEVWPRDPFGFRDVPLPAPVTQVSENVPASAVTAVASTVGTGR